MLAVDDAVTTRQLLRAIIEASGHDCEVAEHGEAAWHRLMLGDPVAVVISDMEVPRLDGLPLFSRVRSSPKTSKLLFVLVTALSDGAARRRALDLATDASVVEDCVDQDVLLDALEELLP